MGTYLGAFLALHISVGVEMLPIGNPDNESIGNYGKLGYVDIWFDSELYECKEKDENSWEFFVKDEIFQEHIKDLMVENPLQMLHSNGRLYEEYFNPENAKNNPIFQGSVEKFITELEENEDYNYYMYMDSQVCNGQPQQFHRSFLDNRYWDKFLLDSFQFMDYGKVVIDYGNVHNFLWDCRKLVRNACDNPLAGAIFFDLQ